MSSSTVPSNLITNFTQINCGLKKSSQDHYKHRQDIQKWSNSRRCTYRNAIQKPNNPRKWAYKQQNEESWRIRDVSIEFDVNPASAIMFREDLQSQMIIAADTKAGLQFVKGLPLLSVGKRDVCNLHFRSFEEMLASHSLPMVLRFGYLNKVQPISLNGTLGNMRNWSKECKRRAEIITELVDAEKNYIAGLEELNKKFLLPYVKPLKEKANVDIANFQDNVISLIALHDNVYDKFCKAENICRPFQEEFQFLRKYKHYIQEYKETIRKLKGASTKRSIRSVFRDSLGTSDPVQLFDSLAIRIVKRPTHYELLLKALKRNTPIRHPMYRDLEKALIRIEDICYEINDFQHRRVNQLKFSEIAILIDPEMLRQHGVDKLLISARRLIHIGKVFLRLTKPFKTGINCETFLNLQEGYVVMCNDILIITYQDWRVHKVFDVKAIKAVVTTKPKRSSKKPKEVFEVVLTKKGALPRSDTVTAKNMTDLKRKIARLGVQNGLTDQLCIYTGTLEGAVKLQKSLRYARKADKNQKNTRLLE